jgi:hypothetical protein
MTRTEAIDILEKHQAWNVWIDTSDSTKEPLLPSPELIGKAIEVALRDMKYLAHTLG